MVPSEDPSHTLPTVERLKELIKQSRHHQAELARLTEEIDRLQTQIAAETRKYEKRRERLT
jgi:hypothetical protein